MLASSAVILLHPPIVTLSQLSKIGAGILIAPPFRTCPKVSFFSMGTVVCCLQGYSMLITLHSRRIHLCWMTSSAFFLWPNNRSRFTNRSGETTGRFRRAMPFQFHTTIHPRGAIYHPAEPGAVARHMERVRVKNGYGLCTSTLSPSVIGRFDASSEKRRVKHDHPQPYVLDLLTHHELLFNGTVMCA